MKIKSSQVSDKPNQIQYGSNDHIVDTDKILEAAAFLQYSYGNTSPIHFVYLDIVKEIQIRIIEKLEKEQFDEPYFIAYTTANFVQEIANDLKYPSKSNINKLISKFQSRHSQWKTQTSRSQLGLQMMFNFMVNYAADLEDNLRANAMNKSGISNFTQNDKNQILHSLASVIYQHSKSPTFPNNLIGTRAEKIFEKIVKFGIKQIGLRHINKSASISKILIQHKSISNSQ